MVNQCIACGKFMANKADGVTCPKCKSRCHYGCARIPVGSKVAETWSCGECQMRTPKGRDPSTPVRGIQDTIVEEKHSNRSPFETLISTQPESSCEPMSLSETAHNMTVEFSEMEFKLQQRPLRDEMVAEISKLHSSFTSDMSSLAQELRDFMKEMRNFRTDLQNEVSEIRSCLKNCNERMDAFDKRITAVEHVCSERSSSNQTETISALQQTINELKMDINDREQASLLNDIEITGMPELAGENPIHIVSTLASKIGLSLDERDIVSAERQGPPQHSSSLSTGPTRPRRIVVRFTRRSIRTEYIQAARVRRGLTSSDVGYQGASTRIYINERLTKLNRQLFTQVRNECKHQEWNYCWTREGRVYVRKRSGLPSSRVRTSEDIKQIFGSRSV